MKLPILDKIIGYFSPRSALLRARDRQVLEIVKREYDAASIYATSDWSTASNRSANNETRTALLPVRNRARDLTRNSPYANKALNIIVSNTVGAGIVPKITGRNKSTTKALNDKWRQWANTTLCDRDNKYNFYGMQAAALRSIVEGGEVIARKIVSGGVAKLWLLEPDYINANYSNNVDNIQGIWIDEKTSEIVGFELYDYHPGDFRGFGLKSTKYAASDIIHAYKVERIGQFRGMPWAYPIMNTLKDYEDYQNSTLIRQKVSACWTAFVTEREGDGLVEPALLKEMRMNEAKLEPAMIKYLSAGQTVTMANPPGVDQYDEFARQTLRSIAAGFGISYESLTGDYSQVNFSSGRMGHLEMQRNIDMWRWQMLIPQFCEPSFQFFLQWCQTQGIDINGVTVDWTCPAREMIDPTKELAALKDAVRSGFKTLPEAIREQGLDPDAVIEEAADFNKKIDALELIFDSDPRYTTAQGQAQIAKPEPEDDSTDSSTDSQDGGVNKNEQQNKKNDSKSSTKS